MPLILWEFYDAFWSYLTPFSQILPHQPIAAILLHTEILSFLLPPTLSLSLFPSLHLLLSNGCSLFWATTSGNATSLGAVYEAGLTLLKRTASRSSAKGGTSSSCPCLCAFFKSPSCSCWSRQELFSKKDGGGSFNPTFILVYKFRFWKGNLWVWKNWSLIFGLELETKSTTVVTTYLFILSFKAEFPATN